MIKKKNWEVIHKKKVDNITDVALALLKNRGIEKKSSREKFFEPVSPMEITLESLGVNEKEINKAILRIKRALKHDEHVVVYGDYDADGITGTATMWETLHYLGLNVLPHIPERFTEGYGLNLESVKSLKAKNPKLSLIVTVDHGITAVNKISDLNDMGIDIIITDHHQAGPKKPKAQALLYTTKVGGSALAWFFSKEIVKKIKIKDPGFNIEERLELAAIGTIADQLPLIDANRSIVKYGLQYLRKTKRPGLRELFAEAKIEKENISPYEVGFIIAPRINSTGRLTQGLASLRLLCTKSAAKAKELAGEIGKINLKRQKIVEEVVEHAKAASIEISTQSVIVLSHESYHEGVIGLAAARLVEEYYRPAIVISTHGEIGKASARSISGFNIIEAIRTLESLYIEGGGHTMAAGFSIQTANIHQFSDQINKFAKNVLTDEILTRKLKIDLELPFTLINWELNKLLTEFEPTGLGNPAPTFVTKGVEIVDQKIVGKTGKHIKMKLKKEDKVFDSIFFDGRDVLDSITPDSKADIVYRVEENVWQGRSSLQLFIKDLRVV